MKMSVPILTHVALLLATIRLEVSSVPALQDFLMTSSPVHAMMLMNVLLPRTPAIMVVPTLKVVIFVAVHQAITELDRGEYIMHNTSSDSFKGVTKRQNGRTVRLKSK